MINESSASQRNIGFWSKINERVSFYNHNISSVIADALSKIEVIEYDGNAVRIDVDGDIFMSSYPLIETSLLTASVFYVALYEIIGDLSSDDVKNINKYVLSENDKFLLSILPLDNKDEFTKLFRNRYNDYFEICNNEHICGISLNDSINDEIDREGSPSRCAMLFCDFMAYFKAFRGVGSRENLINIQDTVNSYTLKENCNFYQLYISVYKITESVFSDVKSLLKNAQSSANDYTGEEKPNIITHDKNSVILPPKANKPHFGMRWNEAYRIILIVLGVLRILGIITSIGNIWTTSSQYILPNETLFISIGILSVLLEIVRVVLTFKLSSGLRHPQRDVFRLLIAYFIFGIIVSVLSTLYTYFYSQAVVGIAIVSAIVTSLIIVPIFIYYFKRRSLFGISFFCDRCGNQWSVNTRNILCPAGSNEKYQYCTDCYNIVKTPNHNSEHNKTQSSNNVNTIASGSIFDEAPATIRTESDNKSHITNTEMKIKYCRKCGAAIDDETIYCKKCGCKVIKDLVCTECGATLDEDSLFCKKCGKKIE